MKICKKIFGASGDLARKKLYPALFELFRLGHISTNCIIVGFSRTALSTENFRRNIKNTLESQNYVGEAFLTKCFYFCGDYQTLGSFHDLEYFLSKNETLAYQQVNHNRLFYLSTPPELFIPIAYNASISCKSNYGWNRLIIEKPFGNSLSNAVKMYDELMTCNWSPHELFHIDHYLGKDIIQKLFVFRFANTMFEPLLNNKYVAAVKISIDEDVGTIGRSSYFENYGIICDMLQSHLVQLLTLITMDIPEDIDACNISDCISDAKVDILRAMRPLSLGDIVLGQYVGNDNGKGGYLDDPSVRFDSRTPTFAQAICHVNTPRWEGVPFILKTGKALERQKGDIRVQLKDPPSARRIFDGTQIPRNEIVFRISPEDKINLEVCFIMRSEYGIFDMMC